jgi:hypothetical protein
MTAVFAGSSTEIEEITRKETAQVEVEQALAALDPGPFGPTSEGGPAWPVRRSSLFEGERRLEEALAIFEHLDERGLCDDTEQLVEQVKERLAAEQEGEAA